MVFVRFVHGETESLCAEIISLKDIARGRRGELISRGELIMYYSSTADEAPGNFPIFSRLLLSQKNPQHLLLSR